MLRTAECTLSIKLPADTAGSSIFKWGCFSGLEEFLCGDVPLHGCVGGLFYSAIEDPEGIKYNNLYSCDSSISTKGSSLCKQDVRFSFNASLPMEGIVEEEIITKPKIAKKRNSRMYHAEEKEKKMAIINELLNQTNQYSPEKQIGKSEGCQSAKSEGGQNNLWGGAMKLLNDARFGVSILGTTVNDESVNPRVLSLPIMDALQDHLPYSKRGQLFWLRYSMVRDGASMHTLMNNTAGSEHSVITIETMDGEVFGAFTSQPWTVTHKFYGSTESFLWRTKGARDPPGSASRKTKAKHSDKSIEVFQFAGNNRNIQFRTSDSFAVGGGHPDESSTKDYGDIKLNEWGFGLSFGKDLQQGTSSACITFESPPLSRCHQDGSRFEVSNIEIWSLTPCLTLEAAQKLENSKRAIERTPTL